MNPPDDDFRLVSEDPSEAPDALAPSEGDELPSPPAPDPTQLEFWDPGGPEPPPIKRAARRLGPALGFVLTALALGLAIPGSPLRQLLFGPQAEFRTPVVTLREAPADRIVLREPRLEIVLEGAPSGTLVHLVIGSGDGTEVRFPPGVRPRPGSGRLELLFEDSEPQDAAPQAVRIRIPAGDVTLLLRAGLRYLALWEGGAFQFGEGLAIETRSDGVTVPVP